MATKKTVKKKRAPAKARKTASRARTSRGEEDSGEKGYGRNLWSGSLSFGLLNIPVGLQTAKEEDPVSFELLDKRNYGHIGYRQYNKSTGREVPYAQVAKGYQYQKGKYVIVTDEDFKRANPRAISTVDIEDFVELADLDPMLFDRPYYLVPLKNGEKGYRLLREVMQRKQKVAIGKVVLFRKQRLVAVMARGEYLVLEVLRFSREVLTVDEMSGIGSLKGVKLSEREIEMAESLVEGMTAKWNPNKYKDTYHDDLMKLIQKKVKKGGLIEAEEIPEPEEEETPTGKVVDLMPLLKKSLEAGRRSHAKRA